MDPIFFEAQSNSKLVDFISQKLNISKNKAKEIIDQKRVFVNNKMIWISSFLLNPNDLVQIFPPKEIDFQVLYEDENFLVVSKGPNLTVDNDKNSLENILQKKFNSYLKAVHRIDKDTTGVVVFAKNLKVFEEMKKNWNFVEKTYYCISINPANFSVMEIDKPVKGKPAISTVILISKNSKLSLFKVKTYSGRKHQIRIHLNYIGFPILGDYLYGPKVQPLKVSRQMLHAYKIDFPFAGKRITVKSTIPNDMMEIITKNFKDLKKIFYD
ncbi:MAG: RluA family pseudouridine synthase [bacterium]